MANSSLSVAHTHLGFSLIRLRSCVRGSAATHAGGALRDKLMSNKLVCTALKFSDFGRGDADALMWLALETRGQRVWGVKISSILCARSKKGKTMLKHAETTQDSFTHKGAFAVLTDWASSRRMASESPTAPVR